MPRSRRTFESPGEFGPKRVGNVSAQGVVSHGVCHVRVCGVSRAHGDDAEAIYEPSLLLEVLAWASARRVEELILDVSQLKADEGSTLMLASVLERLKQEGVRVSVFRHAARPRWAGSVRRLGPMLRFAERLAFSLAMLWHRNFDGSARTSTLFARRACRFGQSPLTLAILVACTN